MAFESEDQRARPEDPPARGSREAWPGSWAWNHPAKPSENLNYTAEQIRNRRLFYEREQARGKPSQSERTSGQERRRA